MKEQNQFNEERIVFSISGVGTTGHSHAKKDKEREKKKEGRKKEREREKERKNLDTDLSQKLTQNGLYHGPKCKIQNFKTLEDSIGDKI